MFVAIWPQVPTALFDLGEPRAAIMERLLRIMAAGLALQGISALLTAVLQSQRRYLGPAAVGVAFNLGIILGLAIGGRSVEAAAWGMVAGAAAQILLQLPQLVDGAAPGPGPARRGSHPRLRRTAVLALPVLAASILQQINGFTDKLFASSLEFGRNAALNYANAAGSAPRTVLLMPLLTPFFPVISRMFAEDRESEGITAFNRAAGVLGLVSVPMAIFLMIYPAEVARIMFGGSKCDAGCVTDIAGPLRCYALAVWAAFIGYLLNRSLSAANRAREIMVRDDRHGRRDDRARPDPDRADGAVRPCAGNRPRGHPQHRHHHLDAGAGTPGALAARAMDRQARLVVCGVIGAAVAFAATR